MLTTCAPSGARPAPVDNGGADDDRPTRTDPHRGTRYIWPARARRVCCRKYRSSPRQALICTLPIGLSVMKLGGERAILAHDPAAGSALGRPQVQDRPGSMPSPRSGSMSMPGSGAGSSAPPSSPPASSTSPRVAPPGCSIWSRADPGSALQTWLPTPPRRGEEAHYRVLDPLPRVRHRAGRPAPGPDPGARPVLWRPSGYADVEAVVPGRDVVGSPEVSIIRGFGGRPGVWSSVGL
jgi:hypothetical protein